MWNPEQGEIDRLLSDRHYGTPGPQWIEDMIAHYRRHGFYRAADLYRLCGDITQGVSGDESWEDILKMAHERAETLKALNRSPS